MKPIVTDYNENRRPCSLKRLRFACALATLGALGWLPNMAKADPTQVVVCAVVTNNNDATNNGGDFVFQLSNQNIQFGSATLTQFEGQAQQCSVPQAVPAGSTQLSISQGTGRPANWQRDGIGFPSWNYTAGGISQVVGSTNSAVISGANFANATGTLTIAYDNASGRRVQMCAEVQDNGVDASNQGATWNLGYNGSTKPVAAIEGQGVQCSPDFIDIPVASTSLLITEQTYSAATGFPTHGYTTTGGQSNVLVGGVGSSNGTYRFPIGGTDYSGTSGDFTVTLTNRFAPAAPPPPTRTFNVCAQLEGDGNAATGTTRSVSLGGLITGVNGLAPNLNLTKGAGVGVRGTEVCGTAISSNKIPRGPGQAEIARYANASDAGGAWNGNAPGYPKWELVNIDDGSVLVNGEGDSFAFAVTDPFFNSYPNLKVRFVLHEKSALGGAGGSPVMRVCNRMLDNNNSVAENGSNPITMTSLAANKPAVTYTTTEGAAASCIQTWPAQQNSTPAGPPPTLDGNTVPGFPATPAVTRNMTITETRNNSVPWTMAANYPVATLFSDAAGTQPLTTPSVSNNSTYTMPLTMPASLTQDAYLFIDNMASTVSRNYQVCVSVVGAGSSRDATSVDFNVGLNGSTNNALGTVNTNGAEVCSSMLPGAPSSGNATVGITRVAQSPAESPDTNVASPYNVTSPSYTCSGNNYNGGNGAVGSSGGWAYYAETQSRTIDFDEDPAAGCAGDVTVHFVYTLPRALKVCTKTMNNGDATADNANINLTYSMATGSRQGSSQLNSVEGSDEVCASPSVLRRAQPGNWDTVPIVASEATPSYASGVTPGFPEVQWESENGLSGVLPFTGTPLEFDYGNPLASHPNAIHGTTGTLKITFLNRAGPQRQVTFCQRVENNNALPDNQGGQFSIARTHNSSDPSDVQFGTATLSVTEQSGQPFTEVCGPVQDIPNLASFIRGAETAPAGWVSATGYPKWEVISDSGMGAVAFSGTGNDTGRIDLSNAALTGNPKVVLIDRAPGPVITHAKQVLSGPTAVAGQSTQYDITYRITATNTGEIAGNYSLDDAFQFDNDVSVVGTPSVTYSGSGGATPNPGFNGTTSPNLIANHTIANGGTDNFDVTVRINVPAGGSTANDTCSGAAGNGLFNLATLNPPTNGAGPDVPATMSACANTPGVADLKLTKTSPAAGLTVGVAADYSLSVANTGAAAAATATVHDLLPANVQYNAANGAVCSVTGGNLANGQQLTCTVPGPINVSGNASFTVNVTPLSAITAGITLINRASVDRAGGSAPVDPATCTANDATTGCAVASGVVAAGATDVQVTKTPATGQYLPGRAITWTITATNAGPNVADGVVINDTVPAGLTNASWTCAAGGGATCAASGNGNINDTINLPVNGSAVYTLTATTPANTTADVVNTATATLSGTQVDTNPANNTATSTFSLQQFDVGVVKQKLGAAMYEPGTPIEYTITLTNYGPANAVGISMADNVPADITNVRLVSCVPSGTSTCGTAAVNGNAVTASDIAIDLNGTVAYTVSGDVSATATQTLINTATIAGDTVTGGSAQPNTSTVTTGLEPQGRLVIVKATNPAGAPDSFAFTTAGTGIHDFNLGDGNSNDISLRPGNYTVTETATPGWVLNSLVCVDPSGDTTTDLATATASINLASGETVTCTYSNFTEAKVTGAIALTGQTGEDDAVAEPGEVLTYTATLSNAGASAASNFAFEENVPAGATLSSVMGATGCDVPVAAGNKCTIDVTNVPANGTATVTFQYTLDTPLADAVNGIANTIGNGDLDCSLAGSVCSTSLLPARARVTLSKALTGQSGSDMAAAEPGEVLTYTLTVNNPDAVASKDFTFTENVPTGATLTSVTGATGCTTPVAAGGQCALDVPSVPAGGSSVVTVQFTMDNPIPAGVTQVVNKVTGIDDVCARSGSQCEVTIASRELDLTLVDDAANMPQNKPVSIPVLANDTMVINGAPVQPGQVTLAIVTAPANGAAVVDTANGTRALDGGITYTPSTNFSGVDSFTYTVCDTIDTNHCATATVTVTVEANVIKVVDDTAEGKQQSGAITIPVLDNDSSAGAPLDPASVSIMDVPANGTVSCTGGVCSYTPNDDFFGTDRFTYRVCDSSAPTTVCGTAAVTIEVAPGIATLRLTKTSAQRRVKIGDLVRYTVTVENVGEAPAHAVNLVDTMPAGFTFVDGSLSVKDDDNSFNVSSANPLRISNIDVAVGAKATAVYMLRVGAGVGRGMHVNRIVAVDGNARTISNGATASVELDRDPLLDESLILGNVFEDLNGDGIQQKGEPGMPGVRIVSVEGLIAETDAEGRYHLLGIEPASASRGSNFILKLDPVTLPPGSKLTTPNPLVRRITPGVPVRFDFGVRMPAKVQPGGAGTTDQPNAASDAGER